MFYLKFIAVAFEGGMFMCHEFLVYAPVLIIDTMKNCRYNYQPSRLLNANFTRYLSTKKKPWFNFGVLRQVILLGEFTNTTTAMSGKTPPNNGVNKQQQQP